MNLDIWSGDWGLPSVDPNCLQVLAYVRMCGAEVGVTEVHSSLHSRTGQLPVFQHGDVRLTDFDDIMVHLKQQNYNADYELSTRQCAQSLAFTHLLRDRLLPATWLCWWVDSENFAAVTRPAYASRLRLPLSWLQPARWQQQSQRRLAAVCDLDAPPAALHDYIYRRADECLTALSEQLGERDWLLAGAAPSSLDARVFGLLAPLLHAQLPSRRLPQLVRRHANLPRLVSRLLQRHFPDCPPPAPRSESTGAAGAEAAGASDDDAEFPHKRRNQLVAAAVAAAAMLAFTVANGLIKIESIDTDSYSYMDAD